MRYRCLVEKQWFTIRHHKLVNLGLLPSNSSRFGQSFATKEAAATKCHWGRMMSKLFLETRPFCMCFFKCCVIVWSFQTTEWTLPQTNTEFFWGAANVFGSFIYLTNQLTNTCGKSNPGEIMIWHWLNKHYQLFFLFVTCLIPKLQEMIRFGEHVSL